MDYTGIKIIQPSDMELAKIYENKYDYSDLLENQYLVVVGANCEPVDYFQRSGAQLRRVRFPELSNNFTGSLKPRNLQQYCAFDLLKNENIPLKLLTGRFGSGKTLACIVAALEQIQQHKAEKIIYVRNNVQVKDTDPLGALPGDEFSKILPYLMPFADHVGGVDGVEQLINAGQLEVISLGYMRGRSLRNSIVYVTEAENLTRQHIQLLMGRIDSGSQLWFDGDLKQRDRSVFEKSAGLELLIERIAGDPLFGYVRLEKSERGPVAALADRLD